MGQSLSQLYVHLTFGTQKRIPMIKEEFSAPLHSYIAGIHKNFESPALIINSVADHIHILFRLSKNYSLSRIVEEVKKNSSKWAKDQQNGHQKFTWQKGYGAFSISSSHVERVTKYISNQKEHHAKNSYKQEVEEFIHNYDVIEYSSEYFWS